MAVELKERLGDGAAQAARRLAWAATYNGDIDEASRYFEAYSIIKDDDRRMLFGPDAPLG